MTTAKKIVVEKVTRPDYEGGGIAYQVITKATRNGKNISVGTDRTGNYKMAVKIATSNAKRLKCALEVCEEA